MFPWYIPIIFPFNQQPATSLHTPGATIHKVSVEEELVVRRRQAWIQLGIENRSSSAFSKKSGLSNGTWIFRKCGFNMFQSGLDVGK